MVKEDYAGQFRVFVYFQQFVEPVLSSDPSSCRSQAIPLADTFNGLSKILVVGNGYMDRIEAALTHLLENLARPVAVLETVNSDTHERVLRRLKPMRFKG